MQCPKCGYHNRDDARLCRLCSAPLPTMVPTMRYASGSPSRPSNRPPTAVQSAAEPDVHPLPGASIAFAPLPKGALLGDTRYHVIDLRHAEDHLNVYLAEDSWPVRVCPHCGERMNNPAERFCTLCGGDMLTITPLSLRHLVRESAAEQAFDAEARLLEMRLDHPGLMLPHDFFVEAPYGPPRRYLVEPPFPLALATTLPAPQRIERVLDWGIQLAQALVYLHRHGISLRETDLDHISIGGRRARWYCVDVVQFAPSATRGMAQRYASNVSGLATVLSYLATGQDQYPADVLLPDVVRDLLARILGEQRDLTDATAFSQAMEAVLQELRRPKSTTLAVGCRTDVGQVRVLNEDSLFALSSMAVFRSAGVPIGLFGVADGMGGHQAGDVASQCAVRVITQRAASEMLAAAAAGEPLPNVAEWLVEAIQATNRTVYKRRMAAGTDMGTTLVVALVVGDKATVANVGDSRAYRLSKDGITRITTDHSLVERLVATGQITSEEAAVHPQRNVIYRTIGDRPEVEVDLYEQPLAPDEALLLCSDGLSGMVADDKMWHIWRTSASPQEACDRLVEAANRAGGEDNATVVIVQLGS